MLKDLFKRGESNMGKKHVDEIAKNISYLRKQGEMTQDALAEKLGITFQAVSKWENGVSCPDIELLPEIARIFNVTVDYLFGIEKSKEETRVEIAQQSVENVNTIPTQIKNKELPWADDNELRAVIYVGRSLIDPSNYPINNDRKFKFVYEGQALNVTGYMDIECGDVEGNVSAGGSVECGDVDGDINTGGDVTCNDVDGDINSGGSIQCNDVGGDVSAGNNVECNDIGGSVEASTVKCRDISGNVEADTVHINKN